MKTSVIPCVIALVFLAVGVGSCSPEEASGDTSGSGETVARAEYVGRGKCAACHGDQHESWEGSHHDLAMQPANAKTVLGDFNDRTFENFGVKSRLFKNGEKFMVHTDGADGKLADFEIAYTFGVYPLQQYLVRFPRGRLQTLGICWDARPKVMGGQRWYHLYDELIAHDDPLHWTGRNQNWNYMCANCHSTNLRKNYDVASDTYATTWSEIDVSCEACHGPASRHVAWAEKPGDPDLANKGFAISLHNDSEWTFEPDAVTASRRGKTDPHVQTEMCAQCHSRRSTMHENAFHKRLLDKERLTLLDPLLYHADGQILDEVYVYGSFAQSKMFHNGVTCTDCHDPHTLKPLAPGNQLCNRCHQPKTFDTPAHHHHESGSPAATCVACHMPTKHYMGVDPRLDHSIRIPRPDLSARMRTPNACNGCHGDKTATWAAGEIGKWTRGARPKAHFGTAIHAARTGSADAIPQLMQLASDATQPGIARATALSMMQVGSRMVLPTLFASLGDPDPLVRFGALSALEAQPPEALLDRVPPLLRDPVRVVRIEAARILAAVPGPRHEAKWRADFRSAMAEYTAFQELNGDQPWAHTNLGIVQSQQGDHEAAKLSYKAAIRIDKSWVYAYTNLADLHRHQERDDLAEVVLRAGLLEVADSADLNHALGLTLVRRRRMSPALAALERAARLAPDQPRYAYTYGVALHSTRQQAKAMLVLEAAHLRTPWDQDILHALAAYSRERNDLDGARRWAAKLQQLAPDDERVQALVRSLGRCP